MADSDEQNGLGSAETDSGREAQAADLFDLRRIIGGLFLVYGTLLTLLGLFDSGPEIARAADLRINLWTGLGMLALAGAFIAWALLRPLGQQLAEHDADASPDAG